ncbi:RWD domain-containing protein 4 isoform X2 [Schistocerca nitens]|uniref:RWD domain-containing protein 4 isoform X2 n=1 Tax=Schistocerca nitens TaxID=7011 RepID=UPI0021181924|nr:RWD domain-containing protein 4 isoform X2 [Schistocerca nitens]
MQNYRKRNVKCCHRFTMAIRPFVSSQPQHFSIRLPEVKAHIVSEIDKEAEQYLGAAMTYTLFEFVKERAQDLMSAQPESTVTSISSAVENISLADSQDSPVIKKVVKKEQLSKAQKRKQWDRVDAKGDRPRGWDWVDVVKHLSQSGPKQLETLAPSTGS